MLVGRRLRAARRASASAWPFRRWPAQNEWLAAATGHRPPSILADATALTLPAWLACTLSVSLPVLGELLALLGRDRVDRERRLAGRSRRASSSPGREEHASARPTVRQLSGDGSTPRAAGAGREAAADARVVDVVVAVGVMWHELPSVVKNTSLPEAWCCRATSRSSSGRRRSATRSRSPTRRRSGRTSDRRTGRSGTAPADHSRRQWVGAVEEDPRAVRAHRHALCPAVRSCRRRPRRATAGAGGRHARGRARDAGQRVARRGVAIDLERRRAARPWSPEEWGNDSGTPSGDGRPRDRLRIAVDRRTPEPGDLDRRPTTRPRSRRIETVLVRVAGLASAVSVGRRARGVLVCQVRRSTRTRARCRSASGSRARSMSGSRGQRGLVHRRSARHVAAERRDECGLPVVVLKT